MISRWKVIWGYIMTSSGHRTFVANKFWYKWAREVGLMPQCSPRQGASTDMQYDLLRSHCDLDLAWTVVKVSNWPFKNKKHMDRSGLTKGTRWCQNYSPSFSSLEVTYSWKNISKKTYFFPLVTSRTYSRLIKLLGWPPTRGHRSIAEIQGYHLTILLASTPFCKPNRHFFIWFRHIAIAFVTVS